MPFFNEIFHVSEKGILSQEEPHASFDVSVVIYNYLLMFQGCAACIPKQKCPFLLDHIMVS